MQTVAASLRVTLGSAAGGLLYNVAALQGASFVLSAGLAVLGFLLSLGLPHLLVLAHALGAKITAYYAVDPPAIDCAS